MLITLVNSFKHLGLPHIVTCKQEYLASSSRNIAQKKTKQNKKQNSIWNMAGLRVNQLHFLPFDSTTCVSAQGQAASEKTHRKPTVYSNFVRDAREQRAHGRVYELRRHTK